MAVMETLFYWASLRSCISCWSLRAPAAVPYHILSLMTSNGPSISSPYWYELETKSWILLKFSLLGKMERKIAHSGHFSSALALLCSLSQICYWLQESLCKLAYFGKSLTWVVFVGCWGQPLWIPISLQTETLMFTVGFILRVYNIFFSYKYERKIQISELL